MPRDAGKLITIGTLTTADVDGAYHIFETTIPEAYRQEGIGSLLDEIHITQFCLDSGYRIAQQKWRQKFGEPYVVTKDYWGEGSENMVWLCEVQDFTGK